MFIFIFVLLNKGVFKCSLLHPVAQEGGSIKAYSMEILRDPISVPPICFNVVQVMMFTRAQHKLKENVCKLKLHYHNFFFFFCSGIILGLLLSCASFGQDTFFIANLNRVFHHLYVFGVLPFLSGTYGL